MVLMELIGRFGVFFFDSDELLKGGLDTREEARSWAVEWMRDHPNP